VPTALLITFCTVSALMALHGAHSHIVEHIDRKSEHLERVIRMSQQDAVAELAAHFRKGIAEVTAKIAEQHPEVDLSELAALAQQLDDIVPDPAPVDPTPVDPPVDPSV